MHVDYGYAKAVDSIETDSKSNLITLTSYVYSYSTFKIYALKNS